MNDQTTETQGTPACAASRGGEAGANSTGGLDSAVAEPMRVQLRRKRGWKMPANTVSVARPSKWGNPYTVTEYGRDLAVAKYLNRVVGLMAIKAIDLRPLRGKNLACWCQLGDKCHADVLLKLANAELRGRPLADGPA